MGDEQRAAFELAAGSGNTVDGYEYLGVGLLLMILLLWAAWAVVTAYKGWASGSVSAEVVGGALLRVLILISVTTAIFIN